MWRVRNGFIVTLLVVHNILLGGIGSARSLAVRSNLEIVKQWKLFSYEFPPHAPVSDTNYYNPMNIVPTSMTVGYDRIFIATPKLFAGVPTTVSYISKSDYSESPILGVSAALTAAINPIYIFSRFVSIIFTYLYTYLVVLPRLVVYSKRSQLIQLQRFIFGVSISHAH